MSENSTPKPLSPFLKETSSLYQDIPAGWPSSQEEDTMDRMVKENGLPMTPVLQDASFSSPKSFEDGSYLNDIFERKSPLGLSNKRQFRRPAQSKGNERSSRTSAAFQTIEGISDSDLSTNSTVANTRPKSFYIKTSKSVAINATLGDEGMSESALDSSVSSAACPSNGIETFGSRHPSKTRSKSFHPKTVLTAVLPTAEDYTAATPYKEEESEDECSIFDNSITYVASGLKVAASFNISSINGSLSSYSVSKLNRLTCPDESFVEEKRASHLNSCGKTKKRVSNCTSHRTDSGTEAEAYSTLADFSMFASNDMEDASYQSRSDVGRRDMQSVVEEPMRLHITKDALACSPNSLAPEISIKNVSLSNRSIILSGNVSDNSKKLRRSLQSSKSLSQAEQGPSVANGSGLSEEASMKRSESRNVSSVAGFLTRYTEIEDSVGTLYDCIQCSNNGRKRSSPASSLNETNDGHISLHNELDENAYFDVKCNFEKRRRTQRSSKNVSQTDSMPTVTNEAKLSKEASIKTSESRDESLHDRSDESPNSANFSSLNATLGPQHGPSRISIGTNMNEFFAKRLHPVNKRLERFSSTSLTKSNDSIFLLSKCMQKRKKAWPKNNKATCRRTLRDRDDGFPKYTAPKLARPAYWATNRLYSFLEEKLYSEHGIYSKRVAEKIIQFLQEKCKQLMKTSDTELEDEIISEIQDVIVKLRITNSDFMFHYFCQQFLPDEISNKIVPSLLPYSESCSRPNYHFANLFTKCF